MAVIIGAIGIMWFVFWAAYLVLGVRFAWSSWKIAEAFTGGKRLALRLTSAALIFQLMMHAFWSLFPNGIFAAIKVFAAVASVAAADKTTMLSAGIAELGNTALYSIVVSLPLPAVLIISIIVMRKVWAPDAS